MKFERTWFSGVLACAITLIGISTTASASIIGSGCVVSGLANQTAPTTLSAFTAGCTAAGAANQFTFTGTPDNINLNEPSGGVDTAAGFLATQPGNPITVAGAGASIPMSQGGLGCTTSPCTTGWFDFSYILGMAVNQSLTITHDDGIAVVVGGVLQTPAGAASPTFSSSTTFTMTGTAGQRVDLFYAECCTLPAVLAGNMPGEVVPEPTTMVLLGSALIGLSIIRRKRA